MLPVTVSSDSSGRAFEIAPAGRTRAARAGRSRRCSQYGKPDDPAAAVGGAAVVRDVEPLDAEDARSPPREMVDDRAAHPADADRRSRRMSRDPRRKGSRYAPYLTRRRRRPSASCQPAMTSARITGVMRISALLGVVAVLAAGGAALFPRLAAAADCVRVARADQGDERSRAVG